MYDLILKNGTLVNEGQIFESDIAIKGDRIEKIASSIDAESKSCLLYTSPSPRDGLLSRMPSSA